MTTHSPHYTQHPHIPGMSFLVPVTNVSIWATFSIPSTMTACPHTLRATVCLCACAIFTFDRLHGRGLLQMVVSLFKTESHQLGLLSHRQLRNYQRQIENLRL